MKKSMYGVLFLIVAGITFCFSLIILMLGGHNLKTSNYYSNKDNYDQLMGRIEEIYYPETNKSNLYIIIDVKNETYDGYFRVIPSSEKILKDNGFYEDVKKGDTITIYSAPGYFGDGYKVPIVGLKTESKVYLNFDAGVQNQVDNSNQGKDMFLNLFIPSSVISTISFILSILFLRRRKE